MERCEAVDAEELRVCRCFISADGRTEERPCGERRVQAGLRVTVSWNVRGGFRYLVDLVPRGWHVGKVESTELQQIQMKESVVEEWNGPNLESAVSDMTFIVHLMVSL